MTWQDRLNPTIKLTSPQGTEFEAYWRGDSRSLSKKVGIFEFPGVRGAVVQDLEVGASRYPIPLMFEGADHDLEAARFINACKERGPWSVVHPVRGRLTLQLLSITELSDPTENGNITQFDTEWIEPEDLPSGASIPQLASSLKTYGSALNSTASSQFEEVSQDTFDLVTSIQDGINNDVSVVTGSLSPIYQQSSIINSRISSIIRGVQDTISGATIDAAGLAGQIQNLVQLPALVSTDMESRLNAYIDMITGIINQIDDDADTRVAFNKAKVQELTLTAAIVGFSSVAVNDGQETRTQAINQARDIVAVFDDITTALDTVQSAYLGADITDQYFSQSQSYSDASVLVSQTASYLLQKSYGLAIEKKFVLTKYRTPIDIAISEYGNADDALDTVIRTNNLKGNDILILPPGREVIVYV